MMSDIPEVVHGCSHGTEAIPFGSAWSSEIVLEMVHERYRDVSTTVSHGQVCHSCKLDVQSQTSI